MAVLTKRNYDEFLDFLHTTAYRVVLGDAGRGRYGGTNHKAILAMSRPERFWERNLDSLDLDEQEDFAEWLTTAMNHYYNKGDEKLLRELVRVFSAGDVRPGRNELGDVLDDAESDAQEYMAG